MHARFVVVLMMIGLVTVTLPFGGCGDNDNSAPPPCCPVCGDGACSGDERTCAIINECGDGICQVSESQERCPEDCPLDCRPCD
jgi:hypothetical protein